MTFKDLQRLVQSESESGSSSLELERLKGKGFWSWDTVNHKDKHKIHNGKCCFNHIIGLPRKDGVEKPMFDYEKILYRALIDPGYLNSRPASPPKSIEPNNVACPFKVKHLWVKKATGLGVTEFMLRFMAWLCLYDDSYRNSQMVIVTGPNQELAIKLIKRMKELFIRLGITFDSKETTLNLNGCSILW